MTFQKTRKLAVAMASLLSTYPVAEAQYSFVPEAPAWHPQELLSWDPESDPAAPYNRSTIPLAPRFTAPSATENAALHASWNVNSHARPGEAKVQAVTTFNTIPAASPNGWRTDRLYAPSIWQYKDHLVFWGSSDRNTRTILVPTAHVVDAAHRNGVRVYGKIFYNWNSSPDHASLQRIRDLLQKAPDGTFPVADKLIEVAVYFGFDGWFINQENNQTNAADAQNMRDFMAYFRTRSEATGAGHLRMVWYDAMTEEGDRGFQNAFTNSNDGFMVSGASVTETGNTQAAHEMFLNFWWYRNASNLVNSRSLALTRGINPYDLFAGIWTENYRDYGKTPNENSGGNLDITWPYLFPEGSPHNVSVALFGAETPFVKRKTQAEVLEQEQIYWSGPNQDPSFTNATASSTPNWNGIAHYIPANSAITTLPFVTHFNLGQGGMYRVEGVQVMSGAWTNLAVQDILPTWRWLVSSAGDQTIKASFDLTEALHGGSSLKLSGALAASVPQEVKLYQTRLPVSANTKIRLSLKTETVGSGNVQVGYAFEDSPETIHYSAPIAVNTTSWSHSEFSLATHSGKRLSLLTLRISSPSAMDGFSVNVGALQVDDGIAPAPSHPSELMVEGQAVNPDEAFSTQLKLHWTHSVDPVHLYHIYYRASLDDGAERVWIGATAHNYFFAQDVRRIANESSGYIEVVAVGHHQQASATVTAARALFDFVPWPNLHHPFITSYPVQAPVLVTGSSSSGSNPPVRAFDNNTGNFTEPGGANNAWVGLDLGEGNERRVSSIQFFPRANWAERMPGGKFQGSNTADYSSGVVDLATVQARPPQGVWTTILIHHPSQFRYVRYLSPNNGYANVAEIKFYGHGAPVFAEPPSALQGYVESGVAKLKWTPSSSGIVFGYDIKKGTSIGDLSTVASGVTATTWEDPDPILNLQTIYQICAVNDAGVGNPSSALILNPAPSAKLTGVVIGGGTHFGSNVRSNVFDGNENTYFEVANDSGWVGLDLGEGNNRSITAVRYNPRNSNVGADANRNFMIGGMIQVSDAADFSSGVETIFTIPFAPSYRTFTSGAVRPISIPHRYVRYRTASGRNANISELEFFGTGPTAPLDPYGTWVTSLGEDPESPGAKFDADLNGDGISNGVHYMQHGDLVVQRGLNSSVVHTMIRVDSSVRSEMWISSNLTSWERLEFSEAEDQSGVPEGFIRIRAAPLIEDGEKRFFRMTYTR